MDKRVVTFISEDGVRKIVDFSGRNYLEILDAGSTYFTPDTSRIKLTSCPVEVCPVYTRYICFYEDEHIPLEELKQQVYSVLGPDAKLAYTEECPTTGKILHKYESYIAFSEDLQYLSSCFESKSTESDFMDAFVGENKKLKMEVKNMKTILKYTRYTVFGVMAFIVGLVVASAVSGGLV